MTPRYRILVVDDEPGLLRLLTRMLESQGHVVVTAPDGVEALALVKDSAFDIVLTDIVMPEMEGVELIRKLRSGPASPKIVAMSGGGIVAGFDYLEAAARLGADSTLSKPFTEAELTAALARAVGGGSPT